MATPGIELPPRPFLYTLDQIATLLGMTTATLKKDHAYLVGFSMGQCRATNLQARSISPPDRPPDWRVGEEELMRWLKLHGFRIYQRRVRLAS